MTNISWIWHSKVLFDFSRKDLVIWDLKDIFIYRSYRIVRKMRLRITSMVKGDNDSYKRMYAALHGDKLKIFIKGKGGSYLAYPAASNAFAFLNVYANDLLVLHCAGIDFRISLQIRRCDLNSLTGIVVGGVRIHNHSYRLTLGIHFKSHLDL